MSSGHRLILLRQFEACASLKLKDSELQTALVEAQARLDGRPVLLEEQDQLSIKPIKWLVEDLLIKDGTNLIFAEPKCGKTRFLLGALGAF